MNENEEPWTVDTFGQFKKNKMLCLFLFVSLSIFVFLMNRVRCDGCLLRNIPYHALVKTNEGKAMNKAFKFSSSLSLSLSRSLFLAMFKLNELIRLRSRALGHINIWFFFQKKGPQVRKRSVTINKSELWTHCCSYMIHLRPFFLFLFCKSL